MTAPAPAPSGGTPTIVSPASVASAEPAAGPVGEVATGPDVNRFIESEVGPGPGSDTPVRILGLVTAILVRPDLWWTALGELRRMAPRHWWRSAPHLPLPDRKLWEFRMVTAYGRPDAEPTKADLISFLEWCRATSATASPPGGHR
jgi:hypothetical protein